MQRLGRARSRSGSLFCPGRYSLVVMNVPISESDVLLVVSSCFARSVVVVVVIVMIAMLDVAWVAVAMNTYPSLACRWGHLVVLG